MPETLEWSQYQRNINYKNSSPINLLDTTDKNERFYSKRHWEGVKTNGLPAAVLPYSKRIIDFKISMVTSDLVSMTFTNQGKENEIMKKIAQDLTDYARTTA
jgi:hypothetical protein